MKIDDFLTGIRDKLYQQTQLKLSYSTLEEEEHAALKIQEWIFDHRYISVADIKWLCNRSLSSNDYNYGWLNWWDIYAVWNKKRHKYEIIFRAPKNLNKIKD